MSQTSKICPFAAFFYQVFRKMFALQVIWKQFLTDKNVTEEKQEIGISSTHPYTKTECKLQEGRGCLWTGLCFLLESVLYTVKSLEPRIVSVLGG